MREIKFRCWNAFANVMQCWEDMKTHGNIYRLLDQPNKYPVMQYTGLKDISQTEIYEGDIVSAIEGYQSDDGEKLDMLCEFYFCDEYKAFCIKEIGEDDWYHINDFDLLVISNKFEDPNLLVSQQRL